MLRALITAGPLRHWPGIYRDVLKNGGFAMVEPPGNDNLTPEQQRELMPQCDAVIAGGEPIGADLIAASERLRVIARVGVGYDAVDVPAATKHGVVVTITPGTNEGSVAEHAFALMLGVARQVARLDALVRRGEWERPVARPLRGQTLGLVGLGRIGKAMVPRAQAFGMRVVACDPVADPDFDFQHGLKRLSLDDLLRESDIVSLHAPMTETTRHLIDARAFGVMRPGAMLINTSRGGLVDEAALIDALRAGKVQGAGLDVFDPEPPLPDNPLLTMPNVVLAPHIGGQDDRSLADMAALACQCVVDLSKGLWPEGCIVNRELGPNWHW